MVTGMAIKTYVAVILQFIIWSGFTLAQWLSGGDHFFSKVILFAVFFYLAFLLARKIVKSNRITLLVTMMSLCVYGAVHMLLQLLVPERLFF